jgi:hypothetical protein
LACSLSDLQTLGPLEGSSGWLLGASLREAMRSRQISAKQTNATLLPAGCH